MIGKIGTDILGRVSQRIISLPDNKCSWLINQALSLVSAEQRARLDANYGRRDAGCEHEVKSVYREIGLERVYREYEEASYQRVMGLIQQVDERVLPREMFVTFMNRIYKREK